MFTVQCHPQTNNITSFMLMFLELLPDFLHGFAELHDTMTLLIFLIKCAKRFEEFWRVRNKAVVLPPPKQFTWIEIKSTHFSRLFGGADSILFLQRLRLHRTIAFCIYPMNQKSKCRQYGRCYLFRLNRLARKKVVFSQ